MYQFEELWENGPRFCGGVGFKLSTDSGLLSDFAKIKNVQRCLDLGSGSGVLCVILASKNADCSFVGIEINPDAAEISRLNIAENGFDNRAEILTADLKEHRNLIKVASFDLVVSNPPYFAQNSGYSALKSDRAVAREEKECTLTDICTAARWALRWGGVFCMVHRPERLSEIFCAMTEAGIEPKRLKIVAHSADKTPSLVLVEGKRGAKKGLVIESPLILTS